MMKDKSLLRFFFDFFSGRVVHAMGDSHAQVFEYMAQHKQDYFLERFKFNSCIVQGATNMGLANPHSQTQAMPIFNAHLEKVRTKDVVIFMLGEVDCGFVIWYRAQKKSMDIEEQFWLSLNNYKALIAKAAAIVNNKVIVCSTPLPTIKDNKEVVLGEVANKRLEITATQAQRTVLTRRYNKELRQYCEESQLCYLDYEDDILDPLTGVVNEKFLNENPLDHHLSSRRFADLLYPKLKAIIGKLTQS